MEDVIAKHERVCRHYNTPLLRDIPHDQIRKWFDPYLDCKVSKYFDILDGNVDVEAMDSYQWISFRNRSNKIHRLDGPAAIRLRYGEVTELSWVVNEKFHNTSGPAVLRPDAVWYYRNGLSHREDGPAVIDKGSPAWLLGDGKMLKASHFRTIEEVERLNAWVLLSASEIAELAKRGE